MKKTKRELLVLAAATTVALLMGVTVQAKGDEKVLNFGDVHRWMCKQCK